MEILYKSVRMIDYDNQRVIARTVPDSFNDYVNDLIEYISHNLTIRKYHTTSNQTEVINCIRTISANVKNAKVVTEQTNIIAQRLVSKEADAQEKMKAMKVRVQKGSLIQALFIEEDTNSTKYLLAKVEHTDFIDDEDFLFKSGFSKDKRTIWKTCLFDISNLDAVEFSAKVYSPTNAQYWHNAFLELVEYNDDKTNTLRAFSAIDSSLSQSIRKTSPRDYLLIRNDFIGYFRMHEIIEYPEMINTVLSGRDLSDLSQEGLTALAKRLNDLPEQKQFDRQFNTIPNAITARMRKKVYQVNNGIELTIADSIDNLKNLISAERDENGNDYLKIITNKENIIRTFKNIEKE